MLFFLACRKKICVCVRGSLDFSLQICQLQVVMRIISEKKRFDDGDKMVLRCLMRRFRLGKEFPLLQSSPVVACGHGDFSKHCTVKEYKDFAWFLVEELLHPWCAIDVQRSHWPGRYTPVREMALKVCTLMLSSYIVSCCCGRQKMSVQSYRTEDRMWRSRVDGERYSDRERNVGRKKNWKGPYALESLRRGSFSHVC